MSPLAPLLKKIMVRIHIVEIKLAKVQKYFVDFVAAEIQKYRELSHYWS